MSGRTMGNHIVLFNGPDNLVGKFVNVRIIDANDLALIGELTGTSNGEEYPSRTR